MAPEKRLDQLEPLVAELMAQLDDVSVKNERITAMLNNLTDLIIRQSDTLQLVLSEQIQLKTDVAELKREVINLKGDVVGLQEAQATLSQKVELILHLLQTEKAG